MASIVTTRFIFWIAGRIMSFHGYYHQIWDCGRLDFALGQNETLATYPSCAPFYDGSDRDAKAIVTADWNGGPVAKSASVGINFGMAFFLALILHGVGVEIYVSSPEIQRRFQDPD